MGFRKPTIDDLRAELEDLKFRFRALPDDQLFVLWFLLASLVEDDDVAARAVTGGAGDKGVDGVLVDHRTKGVFVVQGKLRESVNAKAESRSDVTSFAQLASPLLHGGVELQSLYDDIDPNVRAKLEEAREMIRRRSYRLHLYYVTLGKCSANLRKEADDIARPAEMMVLDGNQVMGVLDDYLDGVAPPIRSLDLPIESGGRMQASGTSQRFDPDSEIESWVFSMAGRDVGDLFQKAGIRLFARNIRGFLGNTNINVAMEETLAKRPQYFWYFNNGVTIVCDAAQKIGKGGREILRVENPQVINGQQTTRVLQAKGNRARRASVLVRVIRIPRSSDGSARHFDELVSRIVEATNWQNAIRPSDLMSNDRQQVLIEREFRKLGYQYLRKRQTKGEARRGARAQYRFLVKKDELAQAVAACKFDPAIVREGKEGLFEERYYASIFGNSSAAHYLNRYWMMRRVSSVARGYPERAYAKWTVLHFVWSLLGTEIDRRAERFRRANELRDNDVLAPLDRAIDATYTGVLHFYRENRGHGPTATDVSTFFKRRQLDQQFERFWRRGPKTAKARFKRSHTHFRKALAEMDDRH
jgi:AIPR protein